MRRIRKLSICLAALLILQGALPACLGEEMPAPTQAQAATEAPTEVPTEAPTQAPTEIPAEIPAEAPTERPTEAPAETPAEVPTEAPTESPTEMPTEIPTEAPTEAPTETPTEAPTEIPIETPTPSLELRVDERYLSEGLSIGAAGETARFIEVIGNAAWQAYCDADWVVLKNATVDDKCGFTLDIAENAGEARSCTVSIEAAGCEKLSIAITQLPAQESAQDPEPEDQNPADQSDETPAQIEQVERDYSIGWKGVVQSDARGMAIPLLLQGDYGATVLYYNGQAKSVASSGCGAASVSMVVAYLTGDMQQNPYLLFCKAVDAGRYHGSGLSHETLSWLAGSCGVSSRWISGNADAIEAALKAGKPVIAHMGQGIFTERGHYIVLRGLTEDGKVLVNDPASASRSHMAFPMETILAQTRTSTAFMVCSAKGSNDQAAVHEATVEPTPEVTAEPTPEAMLEPAPESTVELRLDVNRSGRVDICDAQFVYDVMAQSGDSDISEEMRSAADVNGDGTVDEGDIQCILSYIRN